MASGNDLQWKTLFDNMQAKTDAVLAKKKPSKGAAPQNDMGDAVPMELDDGAAAPKKKSGDNKRLSVERIYQKKSQLEHILLRPDTYVGSVESVTQDMWVMDKEADKMVNRPITYVPGLYKIYDEILVNASDNKQRDPKMDCMKIEIDAENNKIKVWNNGKGIPVVEHKSEKMYVPTMIFGHLLTSSNYDDSEKKVTGGRNGYGAKLCNIFSKKFVVETSSKEYKRAFKQTWTDNMGKTKEPTITDSKETDFTSVTFYPDLTKFKMEKLDDDVVALFTRRAYDIAAATKGVKVFLNGKRLPVKNFKDYVELYVKDRVDEAGAPLKTVHEATNDRWEVVVTSSEKGFQQVSFVNSIATTKGGRHVDYIADQCISKLIEVVKKKNKGGIAIKPFQVKNHLWVFVNCLIENPTFDSQTKENMTKQAKGFGSKCQLTDKFITQVSKSGIVESILSWMKFKAQAQLNKKCHSSKHSKLKGIPKLDDANDAGTKNSKNCTLILTEGDSAKTLAVAGLSVIGRDRYGVFPLKGKLLNVREATHKQIMENAEINNIVKIMGLQYKENYEDPMKLSQMRYGKIMIMTDQDQDGSHIKGLLINFVHHFWPSLLRHNFLEEFITPIVKVTKGKTEKSFYSIPEFDEWKTETENWHTYKVKYYKGLGTSTSKEAKEYFSDFQKHRIKFHYGGGEDDSNINLAFSKKKIEERKEWLTNHMEENKRRLEMGLAEVYLYGKETHAISYSDFVNRELVLYSKSDIIRSIPSLVDGLKPGQRKVMFTCIKRNLVNKEIKVAQLAGSVAELSAYHHGEVSLMGTIINLAQNFVGSNNMNLLEPRGQFGTRIHGGKDAASPRYIFTMLSPVARHVFHPHDDALLNNLYDDSLKIEPEWYCPILPMVLVNGAEGIGTGWSTMVPNYDVREIVENLRLMLDDREPLPMLPKYKHFKGLIEEIPGSENTCAVHGEISIIDDQTVEITELPIRKWTQSYKENVLEPMLHGSDKTPGIITDYKEYHTDTTVRFVVKMLPEKLRAAELDGGMHKLFKITTQILTSNLVLFDHMGCIKKYECVQDILKEFYTVRLDFYQKRKDYMEGMLAAESLRLSNIARFIIEKIDGLIKIENVPKKELIRMLVRRGYDSDPVKAWKEAQDKAEKDDLNEGEEEDEEDDKSGPDFNYILGMPLWNLTKEKKELLCKQRDEKTQELNILRRKSPKDLWKEDLAAFMVCLDETERKEQADEKKADKKPNMGKLGKVAARPKKGLVMETLPSADGRRVVPKVQAVVPKKEKKEKPDKIKKEIKTEDDDGQSSMLDFIKKEGDSPEGGSSAGGSSASKRGRGGAARGGGRGKARGGAAASGTKRLSSENSSSPTKKGGKKRNPWSSASESSAGESDGGISDMDDDDVKPVIPRDNARRAAAAKVKYQFDNEEEVQSEEGDGDDDDDDFKAFDAETGHIVENGANASNGSISDDGSEFNISDDDSPKPKAKTAPKASPKKAPPKKKVIIEDDSEPELIISEDDEPKTKSKPKPKAKAAPAAKKPAAKPAAKKVVKIADDSEDEEKRLLQSNKDLYPSSDDDDMVISSPPPKKSAAPKKDPAPKKAAPKPKKKAMDFSDDDSPVKKAPAKRPKKKAFSDSDDEEGLAPKKKKAVAKPKKKASKGSDSDDDDDIDADMSPVAPRATTGRARGGAAPSKYTFSSEDEDDDFA